MPKISKTTERAQARSIVAGLSKQLLDRPSFLLGGKRYSRRALVALFRAHIEALDAVTKARAALAGAVGKERAIGREAAAVGMLLKTLLTNELGPRIDILGDFGWRVPKKPGPKTAAAKLAGVEKRKGRKKS